MANAGQYDEDEENEEQEEEEEEAGEVEEQEEEEEEAEEEAEEEETEAADDEAEGTAEEGEQPVANEDKPRSTDVENSSLHDGGTVMTKQLMAQMFNTYSGSDAAANDMSHEDISHEVVQQAPNDDWRILHLTTTGHNGDVFQLEAKMDTGADSNWISQSAVIGHDIDLDLLEGPELPTFVVGSGASTQPDGIVHLKYRAGRTQQLYAEDLYVKADLPHDVILGLPFLQHSHAITLNPEFAAPPQSQDFLLFELHPADSAKQDTFAQFRAQKQAERNATYTRRTGR